MSVKSKEKKTKAPAEPKVKKLRAKKADPAASSDMPAGPNDRSTRKGKKAKAPPKAEKEPGKLSALDAAEKVLKEQGKPMRSKEIMEEMSAKGYWISPGGKTPENTLRAAIVVDIRKKGAASRFKKADRGLFATA